jgi:trehalose 6-phosphate phosphatase
MAQLKTELGEISDVWRSSPISVVPPKDLLLVTDFDGTLAEIVPDPTKSAALPEALSALRRLAHLLREVVVLSSRTPAELAALVPINGVRLIGDSGLAPPSAQEKRALEVFNAEAAKVLGSIPGVWLEIKPASTAVHLRNAPISGEEVMARLRPLIKATGLYGAPGRRVIEVHSPFAGKGSALAGLLAEIRPGGVVCMGDDENDRPMFELVSGLSIPHLSVGVSSHEVSPDLFDRCDAVVAGPKEAVGFLQLITEWAENFPA